MSPMERSSQAFPAKGPIALLQEFVQSSKEYPLPPNYSALQWTFDTRVASKAALEHRAVVTFFLDGVPHFVAGTWQASKKLSQRDAADRALGLFVGRWGAQLVSLEEEESSAEAAVTAAAGSGSDWAAKLKPGCEEEVLALACQSLLPECGDVLPKWTVRQDASGLYFCVVEVVILGVPHNLAGGHCRTERAARLDAAKRIFWYFQVPGFEESFQAPRLSAQCSSEEGPAVPGDHWISDGSSAEALEEAKRKTLVMRVQNRLQQKFARSLGPGQSVWEWTYEADPHDAQWPPIFKATVTVPVLRKTFEGEWTRGQRESQLVAINKVTEFLDALDPSPERAVR